MMATDLQMGLSGSSPHVDQARAALTRVVDAGPGALFGPLARDVVEALMIFHPLRDRFHRITSEAIRRSGVSSDSPSSLAEAVFREALSNRFVERTVVAQRWDDSISFLMRHVDLGDVRRTIAEAGPAVLCAFHLTHIRLVTLALLLHGGDVVLLKAGRDTTFEAAPGRLPVTRFIDSRREAAGLGIVRRLQAGESLLLVLDAPERRGRVAQFRFLSATLEAHVSPGWAAARTGCPMVAVSWRLEEGVLRLETGEAMRAPDPVEGMQSVFDHFGGVVRRDPLSWLSWYRLFGGVETHRFQQELERAHATLAVELGWEEPAHSRQQEPR